MEAGKEYWNSKCQNKVIQQKKEEKNMNFRLNRLDTMAHLAFVGCSSYNSYFKQSKIEQKKKF